MAATTLSVVSLDRSSGKLQIPTSCVLLAGQPTIITTSNAVAVTSASKMGSNKNIAPASEPSRAKRRTNLPLQYNVNPGQPHSVARRNARERNRVKQVNNGFTYLRNHLPNGVNNKKMSKVETLKQAVEYIRNLKEMLDENESSSENSENTPYSPRQTTIKRESIQDINDNTNYELLSHFSGFQGGKAYDMSYQNTQLSYSTLSPPSSEASSPTPSYTSEASSPYAPTPTSYNNSSQYDPRCDLESAMSPEDEELLDTIAWWQQSH